MDTIDGLVARSRHAEALLGSVLDIMTDRSVELVMWVVYAHMGLVPLAIPIIFIIRGTVVDALRAVGVKQGTTPFGTTTSRIGSFLVGSPYMRSTYGIAKALAFTLLALTAALDTYLLMGRGSIQTANTTYHIYARGCALGNPGPAGYGAIITGPQAEQQRSGGWPMATNNVMDLWGIIAGLQSLPQRARVTIHTPSKYVIDGATRWLPNWERSGWRTQSGQPVKNRELWQELSQVMGDHDIEWEHLSGTTGDQKADRAMALARSEAEKQQTAS